MSRTVSKKIVLLASLAAGASLAACHSVPTGTGVYLVTVRDAASGEPVEGVSLSALGTSVKASGVNPSISTTDEDGEATLAFGAWGTIDLLLNSGDARERWLVMQDRVAVNGGKSSRDPLRMIVGSGKDGGVSRYRLEITRVERGPKLDN